MLILDFQCLQSIEKRTQISTVLASGVVFHYGNHSELKDLP